MNEPDGLTVLLIRNESIREDFLTQAEEMMAILEEHGSDDQAAFREAVSTKSGEFSKRFLKQKICDF